MIFYEENSFTRSQPHTFPPHHQDKKEKKKETVVSKHINQSYINMHKERDRYSNTRQQQARGQTLQQHWSHRLLILISLTAVSSSDAELDSAILSSKICVLTVRSFQNTAVNRAVFTLHKGLIFRYSFLKKFLRVLSHAVLHQNTRSQQIQPINSNFSVFACIFMHEQFHSCPHLHKKQTWLCALMQSFEKSFDKTIWWHRRAIWNKPPTSLFSSG